MHNIICIIFYATKTIIKWNISKNGQAIWEIGNLSENKRDYTQCGSVRAIHTYIHMQNIPVFVVMKCFAPRYNSQWVGHTTTKRLIDSVPHGISCRQQLRLNSNSKSDYRPYCLYAITYWVYWKIESWWWSLVNLFLIRCF